MTEIQTLNDLLEKDCKNCSYKSGLWLDVNAVSVCAKCKLKRFDDAVKQGKIRIVKED